MSAKKANFSVWHRLEKILLIMAVLGAATITLALQNRSLNRLITTLPSRLSEMTFFQPLSINKIIDDESCKTGYTWYDGKGCVKDSSTTTNTSTPPKKPSDDKPPRKPTKPPSSTTSTSTSTSTSNGASCEGGSKDVKVKDGQYAYSGGVDKNGDYLCWQCHNGTWVDSGTCQKLHEEGANVVAPPPGTAENEEGGKRRQNCSVKEGSTYVTVGDGTVRADGKKCHDGKWVDPANYTLPDYVKTETSITEDIKTDETSAAPALISGGTDACSTSYTNSSGAMVYVTVPHGESALGGANIDGTAVKICKDGEFVPCNDANRADTPGVTDCTTPTVKAGYMTTGDPSKATCVMGGGYQLPAGRAVSGADGTQVCKNGSMVAIPVSVNNVGDFLMGTDSGSSATNLALMTDLCKSYGQTNCTGSGLTTFATGWLSQADPTYAAQVTHQQEVIKLFDIATGQADQATTATLAKDCQTKLGHTCTDAELSTFALSTLQTVDPTAYSQAQKSIAETAKIQEEINSVYTFYLNPDDPQAKKEIQALCKAEKKASCSDSTLLTFAQDQLQVYDPSGKLLQDANAAKEDQTYFNVAIGNSTTLEKSAIKQDCLRENTTAYRKDNDTPINDCDTSQGLSDYAVSSLTLTDPEIADQANNILHMDELLYNQLNTCRHKFQDWDTNCAIDENGHVVKVGLGDVSGITLDPKTQAPASLGTRKLSVFSAPEPCGGFGEVCCLDAENQDTLFKDTNATSACATGTFCQGGDTNFTGAGFEYGRCEVDVNTNRSFTTTALIQDRINSGADSETINKIIQNNAYVDPKSVSQLAQTTSALCTSSCNSGGICAYSDQTQTYSCQKLTGSSLNQAYSQAITSLPPSNTDPSSGGLNQDCYRPTWYHIGAGSCDNDYLACENGKCQISDTGQSLLTINSISKTPETLALNLATVNSDVSNLATYISTTPSLAATGCNKSYSTYKQNGSCWICWDSGVGSIQAAPDPSYCDNPQMADTLPGKACAESGGYCADNTYTSAPGSGTSTGQNGCPSNMSCLIKNPQWGTAGTPRGTPISWVNESCGGNTGNTCNNGLTCYEGKCKETTSLAFLGDYQEGLVAGAIRDNSVINALPIVNFLVDHIVAPITAALDSRYYQASSIQADVAHGLVNNALAIPELKFALPEDFILNTLETISGDAKVLYGTNTLDDINSNNTSNVGGSLLYKSLANLSLFTGAWTERYVPMGFRSGADIPEGSPVDNAFYGYASTWANDDASFGEKLLATSNFGIEISFTVGDFLTLGTESLLTKGSALARSSAIKVAGKTVTDTVGEKILLGISKGLLKPKVWGGAIEKSIGRGLTQVFADTGLTAGSRFLTSKLVTGVAQIGTGLGLSGISNTYAAKWVAQGVGTLASTIGIKNNDTIITQMVKDAGLTADNILAKNTPDLFNSALTAGFKGTPEEFAATLSQKVIQNSPTSLINPLKSSDSLQTPVLKDLQAGVALSDTAQANLILDLSATHTLPPDDLKSILHILDFAEKSGITLTDDTITPFVKTFTDLSSSFISNGPFSRSAIETLAGNNNLSESLTRQLTLALETSNSPLIMPITRSLNPLEPSTFLKPQEVVTESNLLARLQESGLSTQQAANLSSTILHNTNASLTPTAKLASAVPPAKTTPTSTSSLSDAFDQKEVKRVRLSSQDNLSRVELTWDSTARSRSSGDMYRLSSTNITDPIRLQQIESFNKLLDDFEGAVGYHLYPEQVDTLLSSDVISQLKKLDGTSLAGKTDAVTRILSVKEPRSLSLFKSATEAQDFVNTQVLSDSGRKFYSGQNAHVIYLDNQRGFLSVDLTSPHFDLESAQALSPEETLRLLNESAANPNSSRLVFVSDRPSATWTRLGGNTDPSASWFDRLRGRGNPTQNGQIMQQITQGKHGSFLVIPDEIGDDIMGNFAISGSGKALSQVTDPNLLGGLKSGRDAVSIFTEIGEGGTHKKLIDARLTELKEGFNESTLFRTVGPNQVVPQDSLIHANSLAEIIDQSLRKTNSTNTQLGEELSSLAAKLQDPKTSGVAIGELDGILSKASSNTNLARRENNLLTDLSFRKTNLQDDWVQLNRRVGTDFAQEGNDLVLRKARSTTGERLSSTSQLITFYGHGSDMLEAYRPYLIEGADSVNLSRLPRLGQIEISPHQSQMQVVDLYREMQNAGHTLRGFDATPDTAAHLLGVNVTSIATLPAPTKFVNNADRDFLAKSIATNRKLNYAHQASAIGFPSSNADMAADLQAIVKAAEEEGVPYKTIIVAQYAQKPNGEMIEEYLQYSVKDGKIDYAGRIKLDDGKAWNDSIQKILAGNDPATNPQDLLIGYLGRERAVDLKVTGNHTNIRWSDFVDGIDSAPTSEQMEQLIRRNRLVADPNNLTRLSEADRVAATEFDLYLRSSTPGLSADNVMEAYFQKNHYQHLSNMRLDDLTRNLARAPEQALDSLDNIGKSLRLSPQNTKKLNVLHTQLNSKASQFNGLMNSSISREPLEGDRLYAEIYRRADASNRQILSYADQITRTLNLSDSNQKLLRQALHIDQPLPPLRDFLAELARPTKRLTPAASFGPADQLMAFAQSNSTHPSSLAQYRAATSQYLATTTPPAAAAPRALTPTTPASIGSRLSQLFRNLSDRLSSLRLPSFNSESFTANLPNLSRTTNNLAFAARQEQLFNPTTLTFPRGVDLATGKFNLGTYLTSFVIPTSSWHALNRTLSDLQSGTLTTDEAVAQIADLPLPIDRVKLITNSTYTTYPTSTTPAINTELPYESQISLFLTGYPIKDTQQLINKLLEDQTKILTDTKLLAPELRRTNPQKYLNAIRSVAAQHNIPIKSFEEIPNQFKNDIPATNAFYDDAWGTNAVYVKNPSSLDPTELGKLAHETVHALDYRLHPELSIEVKEYRAYISEYHLNSLVTDSLEEAQKTLTFIFGDKSIAGSVRGYLNQNNVTKMPWDNTTSQSPNSPTPPQTPITPPAQVETPPINPTVITNSLPKLSDQTTRIGRDLGNNLLTPISQVVNLTPTPTTITPTSSSVPSQITSSLNREKNLLSQQLRLQAKQAKAKRLTINSLINTLLNPLENLDLLRGNPEVKSAVSKTLQELTNIGFIVKTNNGKAPTTPSSLIKALSSPSTQNSLKQITNPSKLDQISRLLTDLSYLLRAHTLSAQEAIQVQLQADQTTILAQEQVEQALITIPVRNLTNEEISLINRAKTDSNQSELTRELLNHPEYQPTEVLQIGEETLFMFSKLIKSKSNDSRDLALAFVRKGDQLIPRIYWKSNSSGGWRATNGIIMGTIFKGNHHYTQESKPVQIILDYLNQKSQSGEYVNSDVDFINEYFNLAHLSPTDLKSWSQEISLYPDQGLLANFQKFMPGRYDKVPVNAEDFANFTYPEGFIPDFKRSPLTTQKSDHTLLGEITLDTYETTWQNRPLRWVMAHDNDGRVWIDRIFFADSPITSYGVYSEVINTGALTNKPLEYRQQITELAKDLSIHFPQDSHYSDITPLLDQLLPIQQYRQARWNTLNIVDQRGTIEKATLGEYKLIIKRDKSGRILEINNQNGNDNIIIPPDQLVNNQELGYGVLYGSYTLTKDGTLTFSRDGQIKFTLTPQKQTLLPPGVQTYANTIGVPYSQIKLLKTTTGTGGEEYYQIRVNDTYDIGIDEKGAAWGGGVRINSAPRNNSSNFYSHENVATYADYVADYGEPPRQIDLVRKHDQLYSFQDELIDLAQSNTLTPANLRLILKQLEKSGVTIHILSPSELAKRFGEGTAGALVPKQTKKFFGLSNTRSADLYLLDINGYSKLYGTTREQALVTLAQKIGHEGGHALDWIELGLGDGDANLWATEFRQKAFNMYFYDSLGAHNLANSYRNFIQAIVDNSRVSFSRTTTEQAKPTLAQQFTDWLMGRTTGIIANPEGTNLLTVYIDRLITLGKRIIGISAPHSNILISEESDLGILSSESLKTTRAHIFNNGQDLGYFILKELSSAEAVQRQKDNYNYLKEHGFLIPPDMIEIPGRPNTIGFTDLTHNRKFELYSFNTPIDEIPKLTKISNLETINQSLRDLATRADDLGIIIPNDSYFIIIDPTNKTGQAVIGDLGNAPLKKSIAVSQFGYAESDTTRKLTEQFIDIVNTNLTPTPPLQISDQATSQTDKPLIINSDETIIVGEQHIKTSLDEKSELEFQNGLDQSQIIVIEFESIKENQYSQASSEKRFMQTAQEHAINTNKELIILNNEISDRYKLWLDSQIDISRADFAFMFGIHILQNDMANNLPLEESRRKILELYTNYFLGDSGYANQLTDAVFDSMFASTEIDDAKGISSLVLNFIKLDALARENYYQSRIKQVRDENPDKNILVVVGRSHALPISNTLTDGSLTIINTQLQDEINSVLSKIKQRINFDQITDQSTRLPPGVLTYANTIGVPYSQIKLLKTTTGVGGEEYYQIRVNDTYDIGIDENGAGWGGGVRISQIDNSQSQPSLSLTDPIKKISLTKSHPTRRDSAGKVIKRASTTLSSIGRLLANKMSSANILSVSQLLTQTPHDTANILGVTQPEAILYQQALSDRRTQRLIQQSLSAKQRFTLQQQAVSDQFGSLSDFASNQQTRPLAELFATLYKTKYGSVTNLFHAYTLRQQLLPFTVWYTNLARNQRPTSSELTQIFTTGQLSPTLRQKLTRDQQQQLQSLTLPFHRPASRSFLDPILDLISSPIEKIWIGVGGRQLATNLEQKILGFNTGSITRSLTKQAITRGFSIGSSFAFPTYLGQTGRTIYSLIRFTTTFAKTGTSIVTQFFHNYSQATNFQERLLIIGAGIGGGTTTLAIQQANPLLYTAYSLLDSAIGSFATTAKGYTQSNNLTTSNTLKLIELWRNGSALGNLMVGIRNVQVNTRTLTQTLFQTLAPNTQTQPSTASTAEKIPDPQSPPVETEQPPVVVPVKIPPAILPDTYDLVYQSQLDPSWTDTLLPQSNHNNLAASGDGPTLISMLLASYVDPSATPLTVIDKFFPNLSADLDFSQVRTVLETNGFTITDTADSPTNISSLASDETLVYVELKTSILGNEVSHQTLAIDTNAQGDIILYDPLFGQGAILSLDGSTITTTDGTVINVEIIDAEIILPPTPTLTTPEPETPPLNPIATQAITAEIQENNIRGTLNLPKTYIPDQLTNLADSGIVTLDSDIQLQASAIDPLLGFIAEAKSLGYNIGVLDGYRSYAEQAQLNTASPDMAAQAGRSQHQSGYAIDLAITDNNFQSYKDIPKELIPVAEKYGIYHPLAWDSPHFVITAAIDPNLPELIETGVVPEADLNDFLNDIFQRVSEAITTPL